MSYESTRPPYKRYMNRIDPELLAAVLSTSMIVDLPPGDDDYHDGNRLMDGGVCSKTAKPPYDPEYGHLGMAAVRAGVDGEWTSSHTRGQPTANISPQEIADRCSGTDGAVYVPIGMVQAALECDSVEELAGHEESDDEGTIEIPEPDIGVASLKRMRDQQADQHNDGNVAFLESVIGEVGR